MGRYLPLWVLLLCACDGVEAMSLQDTDAGIGDLGGADLGSEGDLGFSGDSSFSSGLDPNLRISELGGEAAAQFCDRAANYTGQYLTSNREDLCAFQGAIAAVFSSLTGADPQEACDEARVSCTETFDTGPRECALESSDCDATVGMLEQCYRDTVMSLDELFGAVSGLSCAEIAAQTGNPIELMDVPSCEAVEAQCPDLRYGLPNEDPG